jgi:hypothetical protein
MTSPEHGDVVCKWEPERIAKIRWRGGRGPVFMKPKRPLTPWVERGHQRTVYNCGRDRR